MEGGAARDSGMWMLPACAWGLLTAKTAGVQASHGFRWHVTSVGGWYVSSIGSFLILLGSFSCDCDMYVSDSCEILIVRRCFFMWLYYCKMYLCDFYAWMHVIAICIYDLHSRFWLRWWEKKKEKKNDWEKREKKGLDTWCGREISNQYWNLSFSFGCMT